MLINSVRKMGIVSSHAYETSTHGLTYFHRVIIITQILTFAIILIIISQMLILNKYSITFLEAQVYLSHISALIKNICYYHIYFIVGTLGVTLILGGVVIMHD
jgi:hypothetical protein